MKRNDLIGIGMVGACAALAASGQAAEWTKHFRVGLDVAFNVDADFNTGGTFAIPNRAGDPSVGNQERFYDDGFVRVDQTGNAGGRTSFWGFSSRSTQFEPATELLSFHAANSFSTTGQATEDDAPYLGFDMAYGMSAPWRERVSIGFEVGFNLMPIDIRDNSVLSAQITRTRHRYRTTGIVVPPGESYEGSNSGFGQPLLPDVPFSSDTTTVNGTVTGYRSLEGNLYSLRLGPTARWQMTPSWSVTGSAGVAVGLLHGELNMKETLMLPSGTPSQNDQRTSDTDFAYGGYLGAVLMYDTGYYWEAFLGAHLISMSSPEVSGAGRTVSLSLGSGIHITAGVNWSF